MKDVDFLNKEIADIEKQLKEDEHNILKAKKQISIFKFLTSAGQIMLLVLIAKLLNVIFF